MNVYLTCNIYIYEDLHVRSVYACPKGVWHYLIWCLYVIPIQHLVVKFKC